MHLLRWKALAEMVVNEVWEYWSIRHNFDVNLDFICWNVHILVAKDFCLNETSHHCLLKCSISFQVFLRITWIIGVTLCWGGQSTLRVTERDWTCSADSCPPVFGLAWSRADRWSVKWICYCLVCFGRSWKRLADYSPRCHCTHYRSAFLLLKAVFFFCLFQAALLPTFYLHSYMSVHTWLLNQFNHSGFV